MAGHKARGRHLEWTWGPGQAAASMTEEGSHLQQPLAEDIKGQEESGAAGGKGTEQPTTGCKVQRELPSAAPASQEGQQEPGPLLLQAREAQGPTSLGHPSQLSPRRPCGQGRGCAEPSPVHPASGPPRATGFRLEGEEEAGSSPRALVSPRAPARTVPSSAWPSHAGQRPPRDAHTLPSKPFCGHQWGRLVNVQLRLAQGQLLPTSGHILKAQVLGLRPPSRSRSCEPTHARSGPGLSWGDPEVLSPELAQHSVLPRTQRRGLCPVLTPANEKGGQGQRRWPCGHDVDPPCCRPGQHPGWFQPQPPAMVGLERHGDQHGGDSRRGGHRSSQ